MRQGRVTVDGEPAHLGQKVDPATAKVLVDGIPLPITPDAAYYLLYKPVGVISTASDEHGRQTVVDVIGRPERVYPVGRLDSDSEGLIILTNDGDLANVLTHPRYGVPKTYVARVRGEVKPATLRQLVDGVTLDDGRAAARSARSLGHSRDETLVELVMTEGRNREVRRMFTAVGHEVTALVRTAIGPLRDPNLEPGGWRPLSIAEVRSLYGAAEEAPT